ncbi:MAG: hypothetical protein IAF58_09680 [Leptolyngbya sp.]|nr:hypothetical protein [Candidatus Melainabacteria bacterium]
MISPKSSSIKRNLRNGRIFSARNENGAVLPFVFFAFSVCFAFLALTLDVMRTVHCASALTHAARTASLYSYQKAFSDDGVYDQSQMQSNLSLALAEINGSQGAPWCTAPAGPFQSSNATETPVVFESTDLKISQNINSQDPGDFYLSLRARRDGADGLSMRFLPLIYGFNNIVGLPVPAGVDVANPYRVVEVCAQPATRIGAGDASRLAPLRPWFNPALCSCFPLALSYEQMRVASQSDQTVQIYAVKVRGSKSSISNNAMNDILGCFVNLTPTGGAQNYYGGTAGAQSVNQLYENLGTFSNAHSSGVSASGVVERDSQIRAFDVSSPEFSSRAQQIASRVKALCSGRFYMMPVVEQNPLISQNNKVVGFARMKLVDVTLDSATNAFTILVSIGESRPMANASVGTQIAAVPKTGGVNLTTPAKDIFGARLYNFASNSLSAAPRGIVMAPATSPRLITGGSL